MGGESPPESTKSFRNAIICCQSSEFVSSLPVTCFPSMISLTSLSASCTYSSSACVRPYTSSTFLESELHEEVVLKRLAAGAHGVHEVKFAAAASGSSRRHLSPPGRPLRTLVIQVPKCPPTSRGDTPLPG